MNPLLKSVVFKTLEASGVNRHAAKRQKHGILVLGYHSILERPLPQPFRYHHTVEEFQTHLDWLGRHCRPVGLEGLARWYDGSWNDPKPPALVTFDDGYRNNGTLAADMLSRMGFHAIFFLSTGYIGTGNILWPDDLFLRIMEWPQPMIRTPRGSGISWPGDAIGRQALAFEILQQAKGIPEEQRLGYLDYLREATPAVNTRRVPQAQDFLSWDEASTLVSKGFEVGSHTVTHPILSQIGAEQLHRELNQSRATIEATLHTRCIAIAYPNGRAVDYSPQVFSVAAEAGYQWGFTVSGRWNHQREQRFAIDRIVPPGHSSPETFSFHASCTGRRL